MAQTDKKDGKQQGSSSGKDSQQQQDGGKSQSGSGKQSGSKDQGKQRRCGQPLLLERPGRARRGPVLRADLGRA